MKKVLIITYYWPPSGGGGVQRWLKFAKYLPEFGWEPVIYTPQNPESVATDESLLNDVPENTEIHKTPIWEPFDVYRKFTGRSSKDKFGAGFLSESDSKGFMDKFAVWVRGNFFIPDAKRFWINPSVKYLSGYLKKSNIDVIISSGPPHSLHLIALKLKSKIDIPWIADFRDPWTEIDFYNSLSLSRYADKKHHTLEKKVLDTADLIISVGKNMMEQFRLKTKTEQLVITNGFDKDDIPYSENTVQSEKFRLVHVGSINRDRNHKMFWATLKKKLELDADFSDNFEMIFVGKVDYQVKSDIETYGLASWVRFIDYLPHNQIFEDLSKASVLYLPLNNTPNAKGILTGKVFEYLAVGRPILAIGPSDGDLAEILKETDSGYIVDFEDKQSLEIIFSKLYLQHKNGNIKSSADKVELYERKHLTKKLVSELEKLIDE